MIAWNYDIESAKTEGWILICLDDEKRWFGLSCWLPNSKRWNMIGTTEVPYAWCAISHPLSQSPYKNGTFNERNTEEPPGLPVAPVALPFGMGL